MRVGPQPLCPPLNSIWTRERLLYHKKKDAEHAHSMGSETVHTAVNAEVSPERGLLFSSGANLFICVLIRLD